MYVRPQKIIDLKEYGGESEIVLEPLDFKRKKQLQNNIGKATHFVGSKMEEIQAQDLGDMMIYKALAYIVSAPFKLNDIDAFYNYMERLDNVKLGNADALFDKIIEEVNILGGDESSPLPNSQVAENVSSEQES